MNNENYYVIHGWMLNELKLFGNELIIYAVIYGFSQIEGTVFNGTLDYLCSCAGCARRAALIILQKLQEKGLIFKNKYDKNGLKNTAYLCNLDVVKWATGAKNAPVQKMHPDNIYIKANKDIKNTKHTKDPDVLNTSIQGTLGTIRLHNTLGTVNAESKKAPVQRVLIRPKTAKNGVPCGFNGPVSISGLLNEIKGGKAVFNEFMLFMQAVKEAGLKIGRVWLRKQVDLINWVEDPDDKILVLQKTMERGWKSLRFAIEDEFKCKIKNQENKIITTTKIGDRKDD